jgi:hypothetical protein
MLHEWKKGRTTCCASPMWDFEKKIADVQEERELLEENAKDCIRSLEGREDWG